MIPIPNIRSQSPKYFIYPLITIKVQHERNISMKIKRTFSTQIICLFLFTLGLSFILVGLLQLSDLSPYFGLSLLFLGVAIFLLNQII